MKNLLLALLLCSVPSLAGEKRDAEKVLHKYQHLLGFDSWKLAVHLDTFERVRAVCDQPTILACGVWESGKGDIWIAKRSEYTPEINKWTGRTPKADQRDSVVHEMVHIVLQLADSQEEAVVIITRAINP